MTYTLTEKEYFYQSQLLNFLPTPLDLKNFRILATRINTMLADYCKETGDNHVTLSSGHRTVEHNLKIGGARGSLHCKSMAVDFDKSKIATWYNSKSFEYKQLIGLSVEDPSCTPKHSHFDTQRRFDNRDCENKMLDGIYRLFKP